MRVLIADDDRVLVHAVCGRLRARGVDVAPAFDALQAWIAVVRTMPDAIILDINMPGGTGFEILRRLRLSARTHHIPVVVVSGSIDPEAQQVVLQLGAAAFLPKPVDFDQLHRSLCQVVGNHSPVK